MLDETFYRGRRLGADTAPVRQAILCNAKAFFPFDCRRIVETDTLDETPVATDSFVGHDNIEEGTAFGAATSETNDNHDLSCGWK